MKIKAKSHTRKHLNFYRSAYGIKAPYRVLVDGTSLQTSANLDIDLVQELPKLLSGRMQLVVTRAVVSELRSLGKEFKAATSAAKRLPKLDGGTSQASSAASSVIDAVCDGNPQRLCVFSEDAELQNQLKALPGVPLIRFARQRLVLVPPSERSKAGPREGATEPLEAPPAPGTAIPQDHSSVPVGKKRGRKAPNPLSCLKKRKTTSQPEAPTGTKRRRRVRRRGGADACSGGDS